MVKKKDLGIQPPKSCLQLTRLGEKQTFGRPCFPSGTAFPGISGAEVTGPKAGHFKCCLPSMIGTTGPEVVRNPSVLAVILHNTCIYHKIHISIYIIYPNNTQWNPYHHPSIPSLAPNCSCSYATNCCYNNVKL